MSIAHFKSVEELLGFARQLFDNRVETFQKDIAICRTPDAHGRHAYFPAVITCIAFAELLSGCYAGRLDGLELKHLEQYANAFMEPEYTDDLRCLGLLYECLRHKVAHLAYPYPVIRHRKSGRLVTWSIHEKEGRPAIEIVDYLPRNMWWVRTTRPWPVSYDCRIEDPGHISIPRQALCCNTSLPPRGARQ